MRTVPGITGECVGFYGNLWVKAYALKAGEIIPGGTHLWDHVSFLTNGKARVTVEGRVTDYTAPNFIIIDKDKEHEIEALEDNTRWWCVHALRDAEGEPLKDALHRPQHDPLWEQPA